MPVLVSWVLEESDAAVARYELQSRAEGGSWTTQKLSSPTARSIKLTLTDGLEYRFRVRAVDAAGRVGDWESIGPRDGVTVSDRSSSVRYSGTWSTARHSKYLGGTVRTTKQRGATAKLTFTGPSVAWIGPKGPTRGKAWVYIDGKRVATVDLRASTFQSRKLLFAANVGNGTHTIAIKALGTRGRPTIALDGLYVIRPG